MIKALIALTFLATASTTIVVEPTGPIQIHSQNPKYNISTDRVVFLDREVNRASAMKFGMDLMMTSWIPGPLVVVIDSPGGEQYAGEVIADLIEQVQARKERVICVVDNYAASMAFNILTHCSDRLAVKNARFVFHRLAYEDLQSKDVGRLTANRLRELADQISFDDERIDAMNAHALGLSDKDYEMHAVNETVWRTQKLLDMKYLDAEVTVKHN